MINYRETCFWLNKHKRFYSLVFSIIIITLSWEQVSAQSSDVPLQFKNNKLVYQPDAKGNRIPNFSYCGYMAGNDTIPDAPVKIVVQRKGGDATARIQSALDYVASLPPDQNGIRGAVLLERGVYKLSGRLIIKSSGVVLRGSGMGEQGTTLLAEGKSRQTLIRVAGKDDKQLQDSVKITDAYVPVGIDKIHVANPAAFKVGDEVVVQRPCTEKWIEKLDVKDFGGQTGWLGWKPNEENINWDRKITAVNGDELTLDVPLTTALDSTYGGGTVAVYHWPGRISQIGIENLRLSSIYDPANPKDEDHCWMAITLENVQDAWVRQVVFQHFAGSAVYAIRTSRRITVQDCKSLDPVSEIGGQRRYIFWTNGQQTLFQRLYSEHGYHDFAVGYCAAGPNAFVQCTSLLSNSFSGGTNSWASGVLFDVVNIDDNALKFKNIGQDNHGAGWTAANSVFWQCSAAKIDNYKPPTAENWAFGCWSEFGGHGYWNLSNEHINPFSLYYEQLAERLHQNMDNRSRLLEINTNPTSSPTVKEAAELIAASVKPGPLLSDWIDQASERDPIPVDTKGIKTLADLHLNTVIHDPVKKAPPMRLKNGWLVRGDSVLTGKRQEVPWWNGDVQPNDMKTAQPAITRYVPGRVGNGFTDDLNQVTDWMEHNNIIALEQNYGLWYDRRRDDHERVRRMNGDVWPPFYELPFARSGKGTAWDGLSKYDLTKYNYFYWHRLKQFADLADQKGLVLIHKNYFQHNIIEAGAHWVDFPWRSANNINHTGFPEPPPFAGDKRIFMAKQFYNINNPVRRKLHIAFIRKCLQNFQDNTGVIQLTAAEFTGPTHFVRFWLDVIGEWEKETGKKECIGLSATKDVEDSILADPKRAAIVDVIDIRQWHYQRDGSLYAPKGGLNLAPRQLARLYRPKPSSFEQVYRAVHEYKEKFPKKAVIYTAGRYDVYGWADFMAGGSLATIPYIDVPGFLDAASAMQAVELKGHPDQQWALSDNKGSYIVYDNSDKSVRLDLSEYRGSFTEHWIDPKSGKALQPSANIRGGGDIELKKPTSGEAVLWMERR